MSPEDVKKISIAASGLLTYVEALVGFCEVNFEILPKKHAVKALVAIYNKVSLRIDAYLKECQF